MASSPEPRAPLAKHGRRPWPVRRLGAFAQRGRAHCAYWAMCRQLFGLFRAKRAILSLHAGWRWRAAQSENQLDTGRFAMKGMLPCAIDSRWEWLRSIKSSCDVIHDASNLLDVGPACVVELSVARFARTKTKQLTARGPGSTECTASLRKSAEPAYWPRRAWPTLHARGRAVCRTVRMRDADYANLPKHT